MSIQTHGGHENEVWYICAGEHDHVPPGGEFGADEFGDPKSDDQAPDTRGRGQSNDVEEADVWTHVAKRNHSARG